MPPTGKENKLLQSQPQYEVKRNSFATAISPVEKMGTGYIMKESRSSGIKT